MRNGCEKINGNDIRVDGRMKYKIGKFSVTTMLLLAGAVLTGCEALDDMQRENFQHACDNLGIQRGTPGYDDCMLQQQRLDAMQVQAAMDRSAAKVP